MNRRTRVQGFTLIEALIGIILMVLVATFASLTMFRAQDVDNEISGEAGAQMVMNFMRDRIAEGDPKYTPRGIYHRFSWDWGQLTEPFANSNEDYANPALYRIDIRNEGDAPVKVGTETVMLREYSVGACWKTTMEVGQQCDGMHFVGPAD